MMSSWSGAWQICLCNLYPDRRRRANNVDWLVVAIAASLPWSTSATAILIGIWLATVWFALDADRLARAIRTPAGSLPLIFCFLAACGMLWADVTWSERVFALHYFIRLLAIPILFAQFRHSTNGMRVLASFLISCSALLFASFALYLWPSMAWPWTAHGVGIPVKDYIVQSGEFALCAFALLPVALFGDSK